MKKVMVVEDSPVDSEHLSKILRGAGCTVSVASSGDAALDMLQSSRPDLVLMDINMPGTDGFATARKMGRHADMKDIPVVFVTSKDQKADGYSPRCWAPRPTSPNLTRTPTSWL